MNIEQLFSSHQCAMDAVDPALTWTDWSEAAFERRKGIIRHTLQQLELLGASASPGVHTRLDLSLLARELRLQLEAIDYRVHAFPVNQLMGVPNQTSDGLRIPFFLTTRQPLESMDDVRAVIAAVEQSEAHLQQMAAAIDAGRRNGISLPREVIHATKIVISDSLLGIPGSRSSVIHPIQQRVASWVGQQDGLPGREGQLALKRLAAALAGPLRRGYEAIDFALDEMFNDCRSSFGVWDLPDGASFYQHCLERWSGTTDSPDALNKLGLAEIARTHRDICQLLGKSVTHSSLPEIAEQARHASGVCYPNSSEGAEAYLTRVRQLAATVTDRLGQITSWRPRAALEIRAVEPSRQSGALYAEFYPATADGKQPSLYLINTGDMQRLPVSEIAALTFHESVPGHHLQLCTTQERTDLVSFRRKPFLYESYCEGWAMYSEQLGCVLLADLLTTEEQVGCLSRRLWMAARLAVDTGVHAHRWSRADAVHFFRSHTFAPLQMIQQEVDRISVWPGQATAYHIGYLAFSELRTRSGDTGKVSLPPVDFHDKLFRLGPVPAGMLMAAFDEMD
jgi:uncharacterized protein (DUF885 family)